jgi:outer membrane receptor protein involved in Fe transport
VIESYANYGQITSVGIENELTVNYPKYGGFLNFALALPQGETSTNFLSSDKNTFLGFSTYKINMGAYYKIGKLTLAPKLAYLSARSGQTRNYAEGNTPNGDFESQVYDANILVDFNIGYANLFKNIDINIAAYNLFDNDYKLLQPYYGTHAPMPVYDRQFMVGIVWKH